MSTRFFVGIFGFLIFHFLGMIIYVADLDTRGGCGLPYLEQPDYCFSYKAGAGLWEAGVIYRLVYSAMDSFSSVAK